MKNDCIAAAATSTAANAGINILRISGDGALPLAQKIFTFPVPDTDIIQDTMYLGVINGKSFSDRAFCVYFKAPKSYTGEDVVEFHCHGGRGLANAVLRLIFDNGARPAEAGEFTKRAFLNGKLSLAQAEGVCEIINAESEEQIAQAYRQLSGEISKEIYSMEERLVEIISGLEAKLDYPEEIEDSFDAAAKDGLTAVKARVEKLLENSRYASVVADGVSVAITGLPNVGKSSLLNALVMSDRAIVTDIAGTTRDVLRESIELDGIRINILDTAGIRESGDGIEKIGVERTKQAVKAADIVIFVTDTTVPVGAEENAVEEMLEGKIVIKAANKSDIGKFERENAVKITAKPPAEIAPLLERLKKIIGLEKIHSSAVITQRRHIDCLVKASGFINGALEAFGSVPAECTLLDIHEALRELSAITGGNVGENIVNEIFSKFCVGK